MPKRVYVGSHAAVEFADGNEIKQCANGSAVEVSEETAREMDQSGAWSIPATTKPQAKE